MPIAAGDIYEIASRLGFAKPPIECNEASARSALSRAYYAAFHSTLDAYRKARSVESFDPGREPWCSWLSRVRDKRALGIGTTLNELRLLRVDADYKLQEHMRQGLLQRLRDADEIIKRFDELVLAIQADTQPPPLARNR